MKKIMRTICLLMIPILLVMGLCSCSSKKKDIVGKWYKNEDKCLDVRSDGTWVLDGLYGSGTWKYLDDDETIEFTDFYGEIYETKIEEDETGKYVSMKYYGDYYKDAKNGSEQNDDNENLNAVKITRAGNFSDGCAWIKYTESEIEHYGLINKKGKLLFSVNEADGKSLYTYASMDGGIGYYGYSRIDNRYYTIVNSNGKVLASSENQDFDVVLAYGDGKALVYKKDADITTTKHMYGVIDSTGKWIYPLTEWEIGYATGGISGTDILAYYLGENMFAVCFGHRMYTDSYILFNSDTSEKLFLNDLRHGVLGEFVNSGMIILNAHYSIVDTACISKAYTTEHPIDLPENFVLYKDGSYKEIKDVGDERGSLKNILFYRNNDTWKFANPISGKSFTLEHRYVSCEYVSPTENKAVVRIIGADQKKYLSVIDLNIGNEVSEPKCCETYYLSDEYICYTEEANPEKLIVLNWKLNVVNSGIDIGEYSEINSFSDDVACVKKDANQYAYINTKGKEVISEIKL